MPLCVGMAAADIATLPEQADERARIAELSRRFVHLLQAEGVSFEINGPWSSRRHPGNVNLRFIGRDAADILSAAQPCLAASTGAACASGIAEPSHVLRAIGLIIDEAEASARFSFGRFSAYGYAEEVAKIIADSV